MKQQIRNTIVSVFIISTLTTCSITSLTKRTEDDSRTILYKGACKHTQTFASIVLWSDSTFHHNAGAFLRNVTFNCKYEIKGDTIKLILSDSDKSFLGKRFDSGLLIQENGIKELGDVGHRHFFKYKIAKQDR